MLPSSKNVSDTILPWNWLSLRSYYLWGFPLQLLSTLFGLDMMNEQERGTEMKNEGRVPIPRFFSNFSIPWYLIHTSQFNEPSQCATIEIIGETGFVNWLLPHVWILENEVITILAGICQRLCWRQNSTHIYIIHPWQADPNHFHVRKLRCKRGIHAERQMLIFKLTTLITDYPWRLLWHKPVLVGLK